MEPDVSASFQWGTLPVGRVCVSRALAPLAPHFFSSRDVSGASGQPDYQAIAASFGVPVDRVVRVRQVHGRGVAVVAPGEPSGSTPEPVEADVILSLDPARVVSVRVADCVPVLLADRRHRAVAVVHAGWRGTAAGAVEAAVAAFERHGVPAGDLVAAIGPSIGVCCYEIDEAVREAFARRHDDSTGWFVDDGRKGRWRLDLRKANRDQLVRRGVPAEAITDSGTCTFDHADTWHSHRRDGTNAGRMVAAIRLAPGGDVRT